MELKNRKGTKHFIFHGIYSIYFRWFRIFLDTKVSRYCEGYSFWGIWGPSVSNLRRFRPKLKLSWLCLDTLMSKKILNHLVYSQNIQVCKGLQTLPKLCVCDGQWPLEIFVYNLLKQLLIKLEKKCISWDAMKQILMKWTL